MENNTRENFWNNRFLDKKIIFGTDPAKIAVDCEKLFSKNNVKDILITGIGYGRNGKYFTEKGYCVDGIEISDEAINIGKEFAPEINFIKGSVLKMELCKKYDAIFCYDILQLFLEHERKTIIENCIKYCKDNGIILFSCLSKDDILFGDGTEIEENTFEVNNGLYIHFSNEFEMKNLNRKLEIIELEHFKQNDTVGITKERSRIYGIYKINNRKGKNGT